MDHYPFNEPFEAEPDHLITVRVDDLWKKYYCRQECTVVSATGRAKPIILDPTAPQGIKVATPRHLIFYDGGRDRRKREKKPFNKVVHKRYVDDGHVEYQCCACRQTFSTGDCLGYTEKGGSWHAYWKFCPNCGTKWDGAVGNAYSTERLLTGRRKVIYEALYDRPYESFNNNPDALVWTIEAKYEDDWIATKAVYEHLVSQRGGAKSVKRVLDYRRKVNGEEVRARLVKFRDVPRHISVRYAL